jgi:hypothetical protein
MGILPDPTLGTFHEDGTIFIVGGRVARADAQFTIHSATGNVSGTKSFNISANPTLSAGGCEHEPTDRDPGNFLHFSTQEQRYITAGAPSIPIAAPFEALRLATGGKLLKNLAEREANLLLGDVPLFHLLGFEQNNLLVINRESVVSKK